MKKAVFLAFALAACATIADAATIVTPLAPLGLPTVEIDDNTLVAERLYVLSLNPDTKMADWIAYEVDAANFGASPGRNWANNPLLDAAQVLEAADYKGVGKEGLDRGHGGPLASFAGSRYWYTLNYLSNITPQASSLNQGPWKNLEMAVRQGVSYHNNLYVIEGPLYLGGNDYEMPYADEALTIPDAYYKVVYDVKGNAAAFMLPQSLERKADYCESKSTLAGITALIPYDLPALTESDYMYSRVGCD